MVFEPLFDVLTSKRFLAATNEDVVIALALAIAQIAHINNNQYPFELGNEAKVRAPRCHSNGRLVHQMTVFNSIFCRVRFP